MTTPPTTAILAAAGQGERFAGSKAKIPKQFSELAWVPLFIWSLTTLLKHPGVKDTVLVVPVDWIDQSKKLLQEYLPKHTQPVTIIVGGNSRQESVYLALETLAAGNNVHLNDIPSYVLIHDAARPFVNNTQIDQVIATLQKQTGSEKHKGSACTLGIPASDSVKKIKETTIIEDLDRRSLMLMQTPQAAEFKLMLAAHRQAKQKQYVTTDDAAIIQAYGSTVTIVPGSKLNLKITETEDILTAQALINHYGWCPGKIKY